MLRVLHQPRCILKHNSIPIDIFKRLATNIPIGEIHLDKIRRLLYLLRERRMPIPWVTADQYQSFDMLQTLLSKGFIVG